VRRNGIRIALCFGLIALNGCGNAATPAKPDKSMPTPGTPAAPATAAPASPSVLWLTVGASATAASELAQYADKPGIVFSVRDCGENRDVLAWAWRVEKDETAAKAALAASSRPAKDGYVKRCNVQPGSLLAFGISRLDASIAKVPADAVNWSEADRVSEVAKPVAPPTVNPSGALIVVKYYDSKDPNDPLEGRRERIELLDGGKRVVLETNCTDGAANAALGAKLVAFACIRGQMGEQMLHTTFVHERAGKRVGSAEPCRSPSFGANESVTCQAESVADDGSLRLSPREVALKH
jgi:hypothetical protein